jgi:hypothetical protein
MAAEAPPAADTVTTGPDDDQHAAEPAGVESRRNLLKLAGAAAGGAAVGALVLGNRAAAANDDPILIGNTTTGTLRTEASDTGAGAGASFLFQSGNVYDPADSFFPCALAGWTTTPSRPTGIYGWTNQSGFGVVAAGVGATATGIYAVGNRANVLLAPNGTPPAARTDAHSRGELLTDSDSGLWYCIADGTPGTWRQISGTTTAGVFHAIDPFRAFDSRVASYPQTGLLAPLASKVVSVANAYDTVGALVTADAVPAGATAVAYNVTVTGTTGPNFLAVTPGDAATFTTSTINWSSPGLSLANGSIVKVDATRQVKIWGGDQAGSTHVIIDVTGYWL